jgi:hypothetical protein
MLPGESKWANAFILARRMMISTFSGILAWMEDALVVVNAFPAGYLETSGTSTRIYIE